MKTKAKVQTNNEKVNVLVETTTSTNRHYSHLNKEVLITEVLSNEEIIALWQNRKDNDILELAKNWIEKQDGYAVSNCVDKRMNINHNSVVKYE